MSVLEPSKLCSPLGHALAEELVRASQMLGELAFDLGSDPETLRRHMASLQLVDHVTQIQLAIADLLRMPVIGRDQIDNVPLADMAVRLSQAIISR
jgi:hypothetical protein